MRWFIYPFDPILEDDLGYNFGRKFAEIRYKFNELRVITVLYNIQNLQSYEILFYNRHEMPRIYLSTDIKTTVAKEIRKHGLCYFSFFFSRESQKKAW